MAVDGFSLAVPFLSDLNAGLKNAVAISHVINDGYHSLRSTNDVFLMP